jgi:hypothetical protein
LSGEEWLAVDLGSVWYQPQARWDWERRAEPVIHLMYWKTRLAVDLGLVWYQSQARRDWKRRAELATSDLVMYQTFWETRLCLYQTREKIDV